jgi:hypothetical protein
MWRQTRTSAALVATVALASCGGDDFKAAPVGPPQQKTEGRAARAITARIHCTGVIVRGLPALARALEDRGYCRTGNRVLTIVVTSGTRDGSAVSYGNSSAATLIQTELVRAGARNLGVTRRSALDEQTVAIRVHDVDGAVGAIARGVERFKAP